MYTLEDYKNAPSGRGPLADTWEDKPHRLVYDLCKQVQQLREVLFGAVLHKKEQRKLIKRALKGTSKECVK